MNDKLDTEDKIIIGSIVGVLLFILSFFIMGTVGAGERGVKLRFGAVTQQVLDEGLYFKIPFVESVKKIDVKIRKIETDADAASRDLQSVDTTIALNYQIDPALAAVIYQEFRREYETLYISPIIQEAVKSATAQFTAEELITKRPEVRDAIKLNIQEKLSPKGFVVSEFNIVNFNFSDSFNDSIEKKVTAEQDALAAKNKLEQVKYEAQQKIEEAKGKAEAIRIEAQALSSNPRIIELRALEKWDGKLPGVTGGAVPFINIQ